VAFVEDFDDAAGGDAAEFVKHGLGKIERVIAEGYGWLVGFDYAGEKASPLPDQFREVLEKAA